MKKLLQPGILTAIALWISAPAAAQSPRMGFSSPPKTTITHPPFYLLKGVTKIAVTDFPGPGECGPQLTARIMERLHSSNKFQVIERSELDSVLSEQQLQVGGNFNPATRQKLQLLGSAALIVGRVLRCEIEVKDNLVDSSGNLLARTRASLSASFRLVEVTTGDDVVVRTFDATGELTNPSRNGLRPEAPPRDQVWSIAYNNWLNQISKLILPYTEVVTLRLHTDDPPKQDWGFTSGNKAMKGGRVEEAAEIYRSNLIQHEKETGKDAETYVPQLCWNLGIALMYSGRPAEAIPYLEKSDQLRPNKTKPDLGIQDAISKAREMDRLEQQMTAIQNDTVGRQIGNAPPAKNESAETKPAPPPPPPAAPPPSPTTPIKPTPSVTPTTPTGRSGSTTSSTTGSANATSRGRSSAATGSTTAGRGSSSAAPKTIELGQTIAQVEAMFGKPDTIAKLGTKTIYAYKAMKVIFIDGKVTDVQ